MQTEATLPMNAPGDDASRGLRLGSAFGALVALTLGLMTLGALVRAHDAGLACPDWPLCFGEFIPRIDLRVGFEWTHRVMAGGIALIFAGLALVTLQRDSTRAAALRPLLLAAALLVIQILLGALTVWKLLAPWTVTAHLVTANAFAVTLLWTALALRERARGAPAAVRPPRAARLATALVAVLVAAQLVVGGLVASRYAGLACTEWPACNGGQWVPSWGGAVGLHLLHRFTGYALVAVLALAVWQARRSRRLLAPLRLALLLGLAQLGVGIANVLLGMPAEVTGLHTALAAALVLSVSVAARTCRARPAA
jgi:cytochrome c oxidase assembly protein subunit 15